LFFIHLQLFKPKIKIMKFKLLSLALCLLCMSAMMLNAQEIKFPELDKSPMDAATYPREAAFKNYMTGDMAGIQPKIKVLYCRPMKKDREIFGGLEPYGKDWRLGANEATEVIFYNDVEIGGTFVGSGTYTMYAEIYPNNWIIKISTERHIGGAENRDITKDIASVNIPVTHLPSSRESFTIGFQKVDEDNCNMVFEWDRTRTVLPISFNPIYLAGDDKSTMDLVQYPDMSRLRNYVKPEELAANEPKIRVVYSRPQKKGRKIFGELEKFGSAWRLGANETTEITFFEDVKVGDTEVKAGKYGIMAVVNADNWEVIIHKNIPSWGTHNHDEKSNVATITVPTAKTAKVVEVLSVVFDKKDEKNVHMIIAWDDTMVRVPITLK
jgi:hypothetical protein